VVSTSLTSLSGSEFGIPTLLHPFKQCLALKFLFQLIKNTYKFYFHIQELLVFCCLKHYSFTFRKAADTDSTFERKFLSLSHFFQKVVCCSLSQPAKTWSCCQFCVSQQQLINPLDSTKFCGCCYRASQISATTYNCSF